MKFASFVTNHEEGKTCALLLDVFSQGFAVARVKATSKTTRTGEAKNFMGLLRKMSVGSQPLVYFWLQHLKTIVGRRYPYWHTVAIQRIDYFQISVYLQNYFNSCTIFLWTRAFFANSDSLNLLKISKQLNSKSA